MSHERTLRGEKGSQSQSQKAHAVIAPEVAHGQASWRGKV